MVLGLYLIMKYALCLSSLSLERAIMKDVP